MEKDEKNKMSDTKTPDKYLNIYIYWFNVWGVVEFEDGFWHEGTVEELIKEHGKEKLIYAEENGWLEFYTINNIYDELETFDRWDITDKKTVVEMHFNALGMVLDRHLLKGDETFKSNLKTIENRYGDQPYYE